MKRLFTHLFINQVKSKFDQVSQSTSYVQISRSGGRDDDDNRGEGDTVQFERGQSVDFLVLVPFSGVPVFGLCFLLSRDLERFLGQW